MHDDIFEALPGLLGQLRVEAESARPVVAASPFSFHTLHKEPLYLHPHQRLPLRDQWRHGFLELLTIPCLDNGPLFHCISSWMHAQEHAAVLQCDGRRFVAFAHLEQVAFPPDVMAFTVHIFARGFAFLFLEFLLLLFNPTQPGNGEDANGVEAHPGRGRNPYPAARWVNAQVDVLDVLEHDIYGDITERDLRDHQYSFCALMMRKMRSTSATSCKMPNRACLITRSRGSTPRQPSGRTCLTVASICSARCSTGSPEALYVVRSSAIPSRPSGFASCCFKLL